MIKIEVLGTGCPKCKQLEALVKDVVTELKIKASVIKVTDIDEIINHGVMMTPALLINSKEFCSGRMPSKEELIKELKKLKK